MFLPLSPKQQVFPPPRHFLRSISQTVGERQFSDERRLGLFQQSICADYVLAHLLNLEKIFHDFESFLTSCLARHSKIVRVHSSKYRSSLGEPVGGMAVVEGTQIERRAWRVRPYISAPEAVTSRVSTESTESFLCLCGLAESFVSTTVPGATLGIRSQQKNLVCKEANTVPMPSFPGTMPLLNGCVFRENESPLPPMYLQHSVSVSVTISNLPSSFDMAMGHTLRCRGEGRGASRLLFSKSPQDLAPISQEPKVRSLAGNHQACGRWRAREHVQLTTLDRHWRAPRP